MNATEIKRLEISLLLLRIGVAVVMLMWTIDKFVNPGHAAAVWENFYGMDGMEGVAIQAVGALQLLLVLGFLAGVAKRWTYGAILALHALSTLSSWRQYLDPFEGPHLLFFAAWPMLAACVALFLLRHHDRLLTVPQRATAH